MVFAQPVRLRTKVGWLVARPNVPIDASTYLAAPPLRRARLALLTALPPRSAAARASAVRLFLDFLVWQGETWHTFTCEVVADFVLWRAAPPDGYPWARSGPVDASTAGQDITHVRGYARAVDPAAVPRLYGPSVTESLRALGGSEKHDSVRKTPVPWERLHELVDKAEQHAVAPTLAWLVFALVLGFVFFARLGELVGFHVRDIVLGGAYVQVTFRRQKARAQAAPRPVSRTCTAPLLMRALALVRDSWPADPGAPLLAHAGLRVSDDVRLAMLRVFGPPPVMPGETRSLPWSLRAGAATMAFMCGVDMERIMRLGRWASRVACTYAVLTAQVQARIWGQAMGAWYDDAV